MLKGGVQRGSSLNERDKLMYLYYFDRRQNKAHLDAIKSNSANNISEILVKTSLKDYNQKKSLGFSLEEIRDLRLARSPHGKPYFEDFLKPYNKEEREVHFSVSHSGDWWACIIAEEPVGLDIEDISKKSPKFEAIAKRFFTEEEIKYVDAYGKEGFFDIWVRKEAYIKFLGTGLSEGLNTFSVIKKDHFTKAICESKDGNTQGQHIAYLRGAEIMNNIKAAYCTEKDTDIEMNIGLLLNERKYNKV